MRKAFSKAAAGRPENRAAAFWPRAVLKNESGFSLLEIVLSIAIVALVSGFVLEMFAVSAGENRLAKNTDAAAAVAGNAVEALKAQSSAAGFISAQLASGGLAWENGGETAIYRCYDKNWAELPAGGKDALPEGAAFLHEIILRDAGSRGAASRTDPAGDGPAKPGGGGRMYEIRSTVYKVGERGNLAEMVGFETKKYFPAARGEF
ncbi:MAG: prepilin-type N-terminal cleavage/methylation domain-containing protein [Firmicutes bacterium]|nr:prepilin-type N-terminal cleavage/methylation domain-containing protein [Bacillota bacterium]